MRIVMALVALPALVAWVIAWQQHKRPPLLIGLQLVGATIAETSATVMALRGIHNLWVYNLYFIFEFSALITFILFSWPVRRPKVYSLIMVCMYTTLLLCETTLGPGFGAFASGAYVAGALVLCAGYTILLMRLANSSLTPLPHLHLFWLCLAMVIWFGGSIPFNGLMMYVEERDHQLALKLYHINEALSMLRYLLTLIACMLMLRGQGVGPMNIINQQRS